MKYMATSIPQDVRNALGKVAKTLHDDGMTVEAIGKAYKKSGFSLSQDTLYNYINAIASGGTPMSQEKATGRKRALDEDEEAIITGLFLLREDEQKVSSRLTYKEFAKEMFDAKLDVSTVSRYLKRAGLSYKLLGPRRRSTKLARADLGLDALDSLQKLHQAGYMSYRKSHLWCIDVVSDTQQNQRQKSFGRRGGTQQKMPSIKLVYTSSLVTLVNANGEQLGPGIFTSNPDLDLDGPNGAAVRRYLSFWKLQQEDLYFIKDGPKYVKESKAMYQSFLDDNKPWRGHVVITDGSKVFAKNGENIFLDCGFTAAPKLNSASHGMLSINDGVIHKIAKSKWAAMCVGNRPQ
jgi:transposase